jgi:uncharacterized membrane-anchored protein
METALKEPGRSELKVPQITIFFWIIKILTTALGESTSDFLVHQINPILAVALGALGLTVALVLQFSVRRYMAWVYWLTVTMVAIFGTMAADVLHVGLGIPYRVTTVFFTVCLGAIFILWYVVEKTLSIHSIRTKRREFFYWATILATFALGTAAGDLTAITLGLGYGPAGGIFTAAILAVAGGHFLLTFLRKTKSENAVGAFWLAYILTRPLGASFADLFGKPLDWGGLGFGNGRVSLILAILIVILVAVRARRERRLRQLSQVSETSLS